jgi:hypothetical protein
MTTIETVLQDTSLWQNRRCLIMACIVATANMQYGFDSAAVGALQAMPGFLKVFGYPDPESPLGYGIDVGNFRSGWLVADSARALFNNSSHRCSPWVPLCHHFVLVVLPTSSAESPHSGLRVF